MLKHLDQRLPRYTSYPTAAQFTPQITAADYARWLHTLAADQAVSLYLHVPFCVELCLYCGCHTTAARRYAPVGAYAKLLHREIELVSAQIGARQRTVHIHWGGGTPSILAPADFLSLMSLLREHFDPTEECEIAIEIDPRRLDANFVGAIAEAGVNRASLGVQDFNSTVQKAIGRIQSFEQTAAAAAALRTAGVRGINLDLMYGLPFQTVETVAQTAERALRLAPDRIALFGYAHVPWMKKHQALLPEEALPGTAERFDQSCRAAEIFTRAGYVRIGLDHFAHPQDPLVRSQKRNALKRNFQGYTTDEAPVLLGFGTSAIGAFPQGYVQNASKTVTYRKAIEAGELATARGLRLCDEDRMRAEIIGRLMCDLKADVGKIAQSYGRATEHFRREWEALRSLESEGLVHCDGSVVSVPEHARAFVRNACAVFDTYLQQNETRFSRAS